jgi:hypothetical protein
MVLERRSDVILKNGWRMRKRFSDESYAKINRAISSLLYSLSKYLRQLSASAPS